MEAETLPSEPGAPGAGAREAAREAAFSALPSRLRARRGEGAVEFTLHKAVAGDLWRAFARPAKKLMAGDGSTSAEMGFVRRFKNLADAALGSSGLFESRNSSLQTSIARNSKSQDAMEQKLEKTRARLQAQYAALDTKMASLNNLSTYMTQQITQMNKSG
jgi:hypothetical protein